MIKSTSLSFFTAIFLAFSGALAEELMVMRRHVTTELYIYRLYTCIEIAYVFDTCEIDFLYNKCTIIVYE